MEIGVVILILILIFHQGLESIINEIRSWFTTKNDKD